MSDKNALLDATKLAEGLCRGLRPRDPLADDPIYQRRMSFVS